MTNTYVHNLDPFAIQFTETFGIRWYGLAYLSAFIFGYLMVEFLARRKLILVPAEKVSDLTTYGALGVLLGGRLGYALFYDPQLFISWGSAFPYWGVLEVNRGGMSSHGGMMGVMIACWLFGRVHKLPLWHILDLTQLAGALGFFFGRLANFVNGELYGREAPSDLSWAVKFPQEIFRWAGQSPEKLKSLAPVAEAVSPVTLANGEAVSVTSSLWEQWVTAGGFKANQGIEAVLSRIVDATQSGNDQVIELLQPILTPRYPSQLIQSVLEGLLVFVILLLIWRKPRKPGVISCWFGILYGIARIIGEQFRMPDAHIGFQALGLTRGQWLSVALVAASFLVLFWVQRRPVAKLGGWGSSGEVLAPQPRKKKK